MLACGKVEFVPYRNKSQQKHSHHRRRIVYTKKELNPQYEAVLSDWKINPVLPDALFEFKAPPGAKKIKLLPIPSHK